MTQENFLLILWTDEIAGFLVCSWPAAHLSQDFSTHLSDKTHGTISDTILRRHGLLQRLAQDGRSLLFQATPQTKARGRALPSVTIRSCGAKGHVVTTLDLVCTDMKHTTSELSLVCPLPNLGFPDKNSNTRTLPRAMVSASSQSVSKRQWDRICFHFLSTLRYPGSWTQ